MTIPPLTDLVFSWKSFSMTITALPGGARCYCLAAETSTLEGIAKRFLGPRAGGISWRSQKFTIMGREHELEFRCVEIDYAPCGEDIAGWRTKRQLLPNGRDWIEVLIIND